VACGARGDRCAMDRQPSRSVSRPHKTARVNSSWGARTSMNAVEIEEAISTLAEQPFDAAEFAFAFLRAFGNKETTLKRLRKGESNKRNGAVSG
jgi:hypothetical protein